MKKLALFSIASSFILFSLFVTESVWTGFVYFTKDTHPMHSSLFPKLTNTQVLQGNEYGILYEKYSMDTYIKELKGVQEFLKTKNEQPCLRNFVNFNHPKPLFCVLVKTPNEPLLPSTETALEEILSIKKPSLKEITSAIETNTPENLIGASEEFLFKQLEKISDKKEVVRLSTLLLESSKCYPASVGTLFAFKNEHSLPDSEFLLRAKLLYKKTSDCATKETDDYYADISRFRLSLYYIWENNCDAAKDGLQKVSQNPKSSFQIRSHYWMSWCAESKGNLLLAQTVQNQFFRLSPLSFHRIAMDRGLTDPHREILTRPDPAILFRTKIKTELNKYVRLVEVAFLLKENETIPELVHYLLRNVKKTEPEFQLYIAVLASKNKQYLNMFKTLSNLFDERPEFITRSTLELSYPRVYFDLISKNNSELDPFLVSALIRQESGFNPKARSSVGALGLMQVMPTTARLLMPVIKNTDLYQVEKNIEIGTKYFKKIVDQFNGNVDLALVAYNAGPQRIQEWVNRYPIDNRMLFLDFIPYGETRNYVTLISRNYYWYLRLYSPETLREWDRYERRPAQVYNTTPLFSQTLGIKIQPVLKD